MNVDARFEQLIEEPATIYCEKCRGNMQFKGKGIYVCSKCGWEYMSHLGKVKQYIEEHGPCKAAELVRKTKVSQRRIDEFIAEGRIEKIYK